MKTTTRTTYIIVILSIFVISRTVAENTPVKASSVGLLSECLVNDDGSAQKKRRFLEDCGLKISFDDGAVVNVATSKIEDGSLNLSFKQEDDLFQKNNLKKMIADLKSGIGVKIEPFLLKLYEENPSLASQALEEVDAEDGLDCFYELQECVDLFLRDYSLSSSIHEDDKILVQALLCLGANPYYEDCYKNTTAYYAAINTTDSSMLELLLDAKIDISKQNKFYENILYSAVEAGCFKNTQLILAAATKVGRGHCLKIVNAKNSMHYSPLYLAIEQEDPALVKILLQYGADCSLQRNNGNTPLHDAAWCDDEDGTITRLLLDHGANAATRNNSGDVPLHDAVSADIGVIEALLEDDFDSYKKKNNAGKTPLLCAAQEGCMDFFKAFFNNENYSDDVECHALQDCLDTVNVLLSSHESRHFSQELTSNYSHIAAKLKEEINARAKSCLEESSSSSDDYLSDGSI